MYCIYIIKINVSIVDILYIFIIYFLLDIIFIRDVLVVVLLNYYMYFFLV